MFIAEIVGLVSLFLAFQRLLFNTIRGTETFAVCISLEEMRRRFGKISLAEQARPEEEMRRSPSGGRRRFGKISLPEQARPEAKQSRSFL